MDRWLDCMNSEPCDVVDLLQPVPEDFLEAVPVSELVNKVANSGPAVQVPIELEEPEEANSKKPDDDQLTMF